MVGGSPDPMLGGALTVFVHPRFTRPGLSCDIRHSLEVQEKCPTSLRVQTESLRFHNVLKSDRTGHRLEAPDRRAVGCCVRRERMPSLIY
jgi:hypothetical protein